MIQVWYNFLNQIYWNFLDYDLEIDPCNATATNRICVVSPTNRDVAGGANPYNCFCQTGYKNVSGSNVCQGIKT